MKRFSDKLTLIEDLRDEIVNALSSAIKEKGSATILLSGGTSPGDLYRALSHVSIDWSKVTVGLVDERFVSSDSEFSNERLVKETLIQHEALTAKFVPMVLSLEDKMYNLQILQTTYDQFNTADCVVLGMGTDGHTASIFPNDILSEQGKHNAFPFYTLAPVYPNERISCSIPMLKSARNLFLLITGKEKLTVLESAKDKQLPIAELIDHLTEIYYAD